MWRLASAGVGIGTRRAVRAGVNIGARPWAVPPSCAVMLLVSGSCCLDSRMRPGLTQQLRWHGGHGHSHGGLDEDEEVDEVAVLLGTGAAEADRITWLGVYTNVVLSAAKGVAGLTFHSAGLLADAVHSMSDLVSDGITLLALKYCTRPPDELQPYGYGKYETIGALSVSLLLVGGSLGIINHSFDTLMVLMESSASNLAALDAKLASSALDPEMVEAIKEAIPQAHGHEHHHHSSELMLHPAALGIAAVSVGAKEALYRATISVGQRLNSSVLVANAWHHRSDAITSIVAMGGIGLSLAGMPMFDPIAGMLVGGIILKMGGEIGWDAIQDLCDAQLPLKTVTKLNSAVQSVIDVSNGDILEVRQLRSRKIGRRLHVDLTLVMRDGGAVSFERACEWKERVKDAIQTNVPRVKDIIVELSTPKQSPSTVFTCDHHHDEHENDEIAALSHSHGHRHSHSHGHSPNHDHDGGWVGGQSWSGSDPCQMQCWSTERPTFNAWNSPSHKSARPRM